MTATPTKVIETERLLLRHLTLDDLADLYAFYQDDGVRQFIPDAPRNLAETEEELLAILGDYGRCGFGLWATIDRETGAFIGRCGLIPWTIKGREEVEVAFALTPAFWGRGLATEAARAIIQYGLEHLHLPRLICLMLPENLASIRVGFKTGMNLSGELSVDGLTVLCYSVSRLGQPDKFNL